MHPAVIKAQSLGAVAAQNNWKGKIDSEIVDAQRITTLVATRNDESICVAWHGKVFFAGDYYFFDKHSKLTCSKQVSQRLAGWPDILELFKQTKHERRPALSAIYVKLPFDHDDTDENIFAALVNQKVFWYNRIDGGITGDVFMQSKQNRIQPIGHRKLIHFIGAAAGFRSVFADQILKVG